MSDDFERLIDQLIEGILGPSTEVEPEIDKRQVQDYIDVAHFPHKNPEGVLLWWFVRGEGLITKSISQKVMHKTAHFDFENEMGDKDVLAYGRVENGGPYGSVQFYLPSKLQMQAIVRLLHRQWPDKIFYDFTNQRPKVLERKEIKNG